MLFYQSKIFMLGFLNVKKKICICYWEKERKEGKTLIKKEVIVAIEILFLSHVTNSLDKEPIISSKLGWYKLYSILEMLIKDHN